MSYRAKKGSQCGHQTDTYLKNCSDFEWPQHVLCFRHICSCFNRKISARTVYFDTWFIASRIFSCIFSQGVWIIKKNISLHLLTKIGELELSPRSSKLLRTQKILKYSHSTSSTHTLHLNSKTFFQQSHIKTFTYEPELFSWSSCSKNNTLTSAHIPTVASKFKANHSFVAKLINSNTSSFEAHSCCWQKITL